MKRKHFAFIPAAFVPPVLDGRGRLWANGSTLPLLVGTPCLVA
jgi:hypothetical protein